MTRFVLLSDSCGLLDQVLPLWQEDGSVVYNCCWTSLAQPFSNSSPTGFMTILHCLDFETPPTWRSRLDIYIPQEQCGPIIHTGTGFPFRRLLPPSGLLLSYAPAGPCPVNGHYINVLTSSSQSQSQSQSHVTTDGQSVSLALVTRCYILSESCCVVSVGPPLWREVESVSCQSLSVVFSPLSTIYYN
jgi:hypothetical protein